MAREFKSVYRAEECGNGTQTALGVRRRAAGAQVSDDRRELETQLAGSHSVSYPQEIRTMIYTTNAIESLHMQLRKVINNRGHFPNDEAAIELIYMALRNITVKWKNPSVTWSAAMCQFAIQFGERFK